MDGRKNIFRSDRTLLVKSKLPGEDIRLLELGKREAFTGIRAPTNGCSVHTFVITEVVIRRKSEGETIVTLNGQAKAASDRSATEWEQCSENGINPCTNR